MRMSSWIRITVASALVAAMAGSGLAQTAAPKNDVLKQIPAGTMGFVVVNNVKGTTDAADRFLAQIGVGDMVKAQDPNGVLGLLQTQAMLAEGFNPDAGFAVAMLDLQQFDINVDEVMKGNEKLPFVLFVPGKGVKEVFGNYEITKTADDKYSSVQLRMGMMFATHANGYVMLSPLEKALDAVLAAKKKADTDTPAKNLAVLRGCDIGWHVNMKVAGPLFDKMLLKVDEQIQSTKRMYVQYNISVPPSMTMTEQMIPQMRENVKQLDALTVTLRFAKSGVVSDNLVTFAKGSDAAKSLATMKALENGMLDRLPTMKYILAVAGGPSSTQTDQISKMIDQFLDKTPAAKREQLKKQLAALQSQALSVQFVAGQPPEGKGKIGVAYVLQVKDAKATRAVLGQMAQSLPDMITAQMAQSQPATAEADDSAAAPPVAPPVKVTYKANALKVGSVMADTVTFTCPDTDETKAATLKDVLGEESIRVLIASPDNKTVVLTFGGTTTLMEETLKTATKGGGQIGAKLDEAMAFMPKKRNLLMLVSVPQLLATAKEIIPGGGDVPLLETTMPIVLGGGVEDTSYRFAAYVPNALIKEVVAAVMNAMGGGHDAPPPAESEEF